MKNKFKSLLVFKNNKKELFVLTSAINVANHEDLAVCEGVTIEVPKLNFSKFFRIDEDRYVELSYQALGYFLSSGVIECSNKLKINDVAIVYFEDGIDISYEIVLVTGKINSTTYRAEALNSSNYKKVSKAKFSNLPCRKKKERVVTFRDHYENDNLILVNSFSAIENNERCLNCDDVLIEVPGMTLESIHTKASKYLLRLDEVDSKVLKRSSLVISKRKFKTSDSLILRLSDDSIEKRKVASIDKYTDGSFAYWLTK